MSRRARKNQAESAFSLFPFLAVLLCAMGSLVVLLVAMGHISRAKALREADAKRAAAQAADASPRLDKARQALAEARDFRAKIDDARRQVSQRLADEQQRLEGIESHVRTLQDEVLKLRAEAEELFKLEEQHVDDSEMAQRELERLNKLADQLDKEIDAMRTAAKGRERRYAIVPLRDGLGGSNRPAVYFECVGDGVVLQPEGVKLTMADFRPPVHVSSPLAAAIRAVERYYKDHPETRAAGEEGSPYPLLVVRPDGVLSYNRARGVFDALDADYGYQPVAQEWPIDYETPNPVMAEQVARAIDLARLERERLAEAAPQLFRSRGPGEDSTNDPSMSRGSFASAGLTTAGGGPPGASGGGNTGNPFAGLAPDSPRGGGGTFGPGQRGPAGGMGTGVRAGIVGSSPVSQGPSSAGQAAGGTAGFGSQGIVGSRSGASGDAIGPSLDSGGGSSDPALEDPLGAPGPAGGSRGNAGGGTSGAGLAGAMGSGPGSDTAAGPLPSGDPAMASGSSPSSGPKMATGEGGGQGPSLGMGGQPGGSPGGAGLAGSSTPSQSSAGSLADEASAAGGSSSGMPPSMLDPASPPTAMAKSPPSSSDPAPSKSKNRSTTKGREGVAMVRSIRLLVTGDSLAIVEERVRADGTRGPAAGAPVLLGDSAYAARDAVFGALKQHAESWGIPGDGMYWQPTLTLNVVAGGEARATELTNLFQSAGLSVNQATANTAAGSGGSNATQRR
jgi:hypothetical protein